MLFKLSPAVFALMISLPVAANDYYAAPNGGGDGSSSSNPFQIADFWKVAKPGDTLLLLDGKYTGADSMINPPQGLRGTKDAPIIVKALNDGNVEIDGQRRYRPARLNRKLTDKTLWPWPMNQRIIDAMKLAGYDDPVDVTKTVFELAGGKPPNFGTNR